MIGLETDTLPPNIHFQTPRDALDGIKYGRLKVVTENTPIEDQANVLAAINNFGFGGSNCHVIIRQMAQKKSFPIKDDLPRLICVSGRTRKVVQSIIDDINNTVLDFEYVALLHNLFSKNTPTDPYKGYTIVSKSGPLKSSVLKVDPGRSSLLRIDFSGIFTSYKILGKILLNYPIFSETVER